MFNVNVKSRMEDSRGSVFPTLNVSREGQSKDGHGMEDSAFHLVEEYKKKFSCCLKAILFQDHENCKVIDPSFNFKLISLSRLFKRA